MPWLPRIVAETTRARGAGIDEWAGALDPEQWQALGRQYLERTADWHRDTPVFTDKLPGNHAYVGALLNMLPEAQVVSVHRDGRDACVSNFRQLFMAGNEFSYSLTDLAAYWADFERTLATWAEIAPQRVHRLSYEALVTSPEDEIRTLLEFLDLPWDQRCLHPEDAERAVNTASAAQVREGIHAGGVGAWKRYEAHLAPLLDALAAEAI